MQNCWIFPHKNKSWELNTYALLGGVCHKLFETLIVSELLIPLVVAKVVCETFGSIKLQLETKSAGAGKEVPRENIE